MAVAVDMCRMGFVEGFDGELMVQTDNVAAAEVVGPVALLDSGHANFQQGCRTD